MGLNEELPDLVIRLKGNKGRLILSSTLVVCKQKIYNTLQVTYNERVNTKIDMSDYYLDS